MKKLIILIFLILLTSCENSKSNDTIELNYEFLKNEKKIELKFFNNTQENFIVIVPKVIGFNDMGSGENKVERYSNLQAIITTPTENTIIGRKMRNILLENTSLKTNMENSPTAISLKRGETKILNYKLENDFLRNHTYKSTFFKMRDVLNVPYNIDMIKKLLENKSENDYKIYLDDFTIKDSIVIKMGNG